MRVTKKVCVYLKEKGKWSSNVCTDCRLELTCADNPANDLGKQIFDTANKMNKALAEQYR